MATTKKKLTDNIGRNVRMHRKAADLTQTELAEKAGTHQSSIAYLESGKAGVSLEMIVKLSNALKVDPAQLMLGA